MATKTTGREWNLSVLWNDSIRLIPERELVPRNHIWASELGGSFIDRYLKMNAVLPTNPPNERSRRKFAAGHVWEWIIGLILTSIGVLKQRQLRGEVELPGCLKVTGKLDFIAGGPVDWEKARAEVAKVRSVFALSMDEMPAFLHHAVDYILDAMEKEYGTHPLKEYVIENKSVSSFMFEKIQKAGSPLPNHILQSFHYVLANPEIDEAKITYISKDDSLMDEYSVGKSQQAQDIYYQDVKQMTDYLLAANKKNPMKTLPPREPEVLFDPDMFRFEKNFKCEYSSYLELLYGYKTPEDYRLKWAKDIASWNRTFKRAVRGDKLTDLNKHVIREVVKVFPEWDKYVYAAKSVGAFLKPEELEEVE